MHSAVQAFPISDTYTAARLDPNGEVAKGVTRFFSAFVDPAGCAGRVLDFGCGVGASTFALARLLPRAQIVGVELDAARVDTANELARAYGLSNVVFHASPAGDQLPINIGTFDYVMLCAVYEHLLPHERRTVLPVIWSALKPGGMLLISGTPHRWFPIEHHTTGLPILNYLPNAIAHALARRFGKLPRHGDWSDYLRAGIRGGTEWSMQRELGSAARVVQPRDGDRADYWFRHLGPRHRLAKRMLAHLFRMSDRLLGTIPGTHVEVAFQKR